MQRDIWFNGFVQNTDETLYNYYEINYGSNYFNAFKLQFVEAIYLEYDKVLNIESTYVFNNRYQLLKMNVSSISKLLMKYQKFVINFNFNVW